MIATFALCERLTSMGYPCHPHDRTIVWESDATLDEAICEALLAIPDDPDEFLGFDLGALGLADIILAPLQDYKDSLIMEKRKAAILDALATKIADETVDLTDGALNTVFTDVRSAAISVQATPDELVEGDLKVIRK